MATEAAESAMTSARRPAFIRAVLRILLSFDMDFSKGFFPCSTASCRQHRQGAVRPCDGDVTGLRQPPFSHWRPAINLRICGMRRAVVTPLSHGGRLAAKPLCETPSCGRVKPLRPKLEPIQPDDKERSMMRNRNVASLALALALGGSMAQAQAVKVESGIPAYGKTSGVSGNLSSVGSDTLNNLMTFWAEGYKKEYPNIRIQIEGKGSTTAPPALIQGTSQLGPMSRTMKAEEIDAFEKKYGYKPTAVRVAVDGIGVFVNKDNPVKCLTMQQIDGIFSQGRACGGKAINKWGDAGVTEGGWASQPISLYGRNSASGTYGYFKEHALCKGDYRDTVKEQPGSASVVQGVTEDKYAIGYS